jgi:hypothetical protein
MILSTWREAEAKRQLTRKLARIERQNKKILEKLGVSDASESKSESESSA